MSNFFLTGPETERFWSNAEIRRENECWPWKGTCIAKDGRGTFRLNGRNYSAPSVSLRLFAGPPPAGKPFACHTCDNPNCVNPGHLWWGSTQDNAIDASNKGRFPNQQKDACPYGHPFSGDNLRVDKRGYRICRTCQRLNHQAYKKRVRVAARAALTGDAQEAGE